MRVIVPHAANQERGHQGLYTDTIMALAQHSPVVVEYVSTAGDEEAYSRLLERLWADRTTFVLVEHDIVVHDQVFLEFEACPEPWCAFPYAMTTEEMVALGCTRFRSELLTEVPHAIEEACRIDDDGVPARRWVRMDTRIDRVLRRYGYRPHEHHPPVGHLNPGQQVRGRQ